jgi:hypothetical protein
MFYESDENSTKGTVIGDASAILGEQWHNCEYVLVEIYFESEAIQAAGADAMGLSADITGTIKVVQWNEYVAGP